MTGRRAAVSVLAIWLAGACAPVVAQDYAGPIIDAHAHVRTGANDWTGDPAQPEGVAALRALDAKAGIDRSALIVVATGGPEAARKKNDALLALAAKHRKHFYPVASVHPADGGAALAELDRLAGLGVKQIKLHPNSQEFDVADPAVAAVTQRAGERGMAILIDCFNPFDPGQFGKLLKLALMQPKTRFVLAHMNYTAFRDTATVGLLRGMGGGQNIYFDLSAIAVAYADSPVEPELVWTMRKIGMDRIIFGSDWPVHEPGAALDAVRRLGLTAEEQRLVLHDNMAALLK